MEETITRFFERYERLFNQALAGQADMNEVAGMYAAEFIAASPAGVMAGKNDEQLRQAMAQGYERYRALGTKNMRLRNVRISRMDDQHCVAHAAWTATYARAGEADIVIDFEVHYLVQVIEDVPKVFGWVSGDEEAVLREHGVFPRPA